MHCMNCGEAYPAVGAPYHCEKCGGLWGFARFPEWDKQSIDIHDRSIWRYRAFFDLPEHAQQVSLGEGGTPLIWCKINGRDFGFKLESLNPSGSFKDRGTALLLSFLLSRGVSCIVEDSSGNAGASLAAYAAHSGIRAKIFIPAYASGPKKLQIEMYGAEVVPVQGKRSQVAEAVKALAAQGEVYASHVYFPQTMVGFSTIAYELFEEIGDSPGTIICPVGQGNLLLGIIWGFENLHQSKAITRMPFFMGVQALACAPIWAVFRYGSAGLGWVVEGETCAEGVRIFRPVRADELLHRIVAHHGTMVAVEEEAILPARDNLARLGFYVEPTSAIVWAAVEQLKEALPEPIILILTGTAYKSTL